MKLHNTLSRAVEPFTPADDDTVRFYVCGPTVYDHLHVGNVRPVIVFDALRRYMEQFKGWTVLYAQNVTDVDDKLINRSRDTGEPVEDIAERFTEAFFSLLDALGVKRPTHSPRATDHIDGMIELIERLVAADAAYASDGDVYFRVHAAQDYGKLSGRDLQEQEAGARVEASEKKEHPLDFTLWKAAKEGEPRWPSPWGEGRPGWHTECVVLSRDLLGGPLDIHAGGNDLVFPHHENEIAQFEAAYHEPFARFWLHNGMLTIGGEEMHKSSGNFAYAYQVVDRFGAGAIRYLYLSHHYRKPLEFSDRAVDDASSALRRLQTFADDTAAQLRGAESAEARDLGAFGETLSRLRARYVEAMDDDFNTVGAIAVLQDLVSAANRHRQDAEDPRDGLRAALALLRELDGPLGLLPRQDGAEDGALEGALIELLIDLREQLRAARSYELADEIRDRLASLGVALKDGAEGTLWVRHGSATAGSGGDR
jgi:cysteinyl-tRNA synthetase